MRNGTRPSQQRRRGCHSRTRRRTVSTILPKGARQRRQSGTSPAHRPLHECHIHCRSASSKWSRTFSKKELASSIEERIDPQHPHLNIQRHYELLGVPRSTTTTSRGRRARKTCACSAASTGSPRAPLIEGAGTKNGEDIRPRLHPAEWVSHQQHERVTSL